METKSGRCQSRRGPQALVMRFCASRDRDRDHVRIYKPSPYNTLSRLSAFTLIELLVVISILGLLMALLLPALSRARKQARAVVCQSKLRQIGVGLSMSLDEHGGQLATQAEGEGELVSAVFETETTFEDCPDLALCPSATRVSETDTSATWMDPFAAGELREGFLISYGLNYEVFSVYANRLVSNTHTLKRPFRVPAVLDAMAPAVFYSSDGEPPPYHGVIDRRTKNYVCINRHETGTTNALFLDFSVRKVGLKELWTLKWDRLFDTAGPWTKAGGVTPADWPEWMRNFKDY